MSLKPDSFESGDAKKGISDGGNIHMVIPKLGSKFITIPGRSLQGSKSGTVTYGCLGHHENWCLMETFRFSFPSFGSRVQIPAAAQQK